MGNLFEFWALMKLGSLHQLWARAKHDLSGVSASMIDKPGRSIVDPAPHAMS